MQKKMPGKAAELLNRIEYKWNPGKETPQRLDLWHTPNRIKRNKNKDPQYSLITFNPDTRSTHCLLGGIRIFGKIPGHKSKEGDPFRKDKSPARTRNDIEPGGLAKISTDGSAVNNGWENATAGIGVWYADGSRRNIAMKLTNHESRIASNSRAELAAILEALRQNETDDLEIESDSLTSLKAICTHSEKYFDS